MAFRNITLRKPILASILKQRGTCMIVIGAAALQLTLVFLGLPGWQSPFHAFFGVPDLGCGLSRALVAMFRGDWQTALTFHALAPFFAAALGLIALAAILPRGSRDKLVSLVEDLELRTGLTAILLIALVIYWLIRLVFFHDAFLKLVAA